MRDLDQELAQLKDDLLSLKSKVELSKYVAVAGGAVSSSQPETTMMHVRLQENLANVNSLVRYLWSRAANYALSHKRRIQLDTEMKALEPGDHSIALLIAEATRAAFLEFNEKYPHRSSEVGELLAYCIAIEQLGAAQLVAKMSLKTNNNMPVHGLDGIHAAVEGPWLMLYFLESKLSKSANSGVADFAESVAKFSADPKQYRLEYSLIQGMGNFDTLVGKSREIALQYFNVMASPDDAPRRERFVGVILYSDKKLFTDLPPVEKTQLPGFHEKELGAACSKLLVSHQQAALTHLTKHGADPNKCHVYFVAVPDVDELRKQFYTTMGYVPKATEQTAPVAPALASANGAKVVTAKKQSKGKKT